MRKNAPYSKSFTFQGKKYTVRAFTEEEVFRKLEAKKDEVYNNRLFEVEEMNMNQYFQQYQERREGKKSEQTLRTQRFQYAAVSQCPVDANGRLFGEVPLGELTVRHCNTLQRNLSKMKRGDKKPDSSNPGKALYTSQSINDMLALCKRIFEAAIIESQSNKGSLIFNPFKGVEPLRRTEPDATETTHRALTDEEIEKFFKAAAGSWYYWHYVFLLNSGLRCGELAALRLADIDFKNHTVKIERTATKSNAGAQVIGDRTKTKASRREIGLDDDLERAIKNQIEINKAALGAGPVIRIDKGDDSELTYLQKRNRDLSELIFLSSEGTLLNVTVINRDIRRKCQKAGIERFSCHAFRHTYATHAIEQGMNPNTLQKVLGHGSFKMTMDKYSHALPKNMLQEMNAVKFKIS